MTSGSTVEYDAEILRQCPHDVMRTAPAQLREAGSPTEIRPDCRLVAPGVRAAAPTSDRTVRTASCGRARIPAHHADGTHPFDEVCGAAGTAVASLPTRSAPVGDGLRISVLGPLLVERDSNRVPLGPRLSQLFIALLMEPGVAIPATRLVHLLWGVQAPEAAADTLRSHVCHLRRALGKPKAENSLITTGRGAGLGYRFEIDRERIDAHRFTADCVRGHRLLRSGDPAAARHALDAALRQWRGDPYFEVADRPFALPRRAALIVQCRAARRDHAAALTALGYYDDATAALAALVAAEPYDEALRRDYAMILYAQERIAEAAATCREGIALLADDGLDAPGLQALQRAVLRREAAPRPAAVRNANGVSGLIFR